MAWIFLLGSVLFTVVGQLVYKQYSMNKQKLWLFGGIGLGCFCFKTLLIIYTIM